MDDAKNDFKKGYRSGYGQAKADILKEISTAIQLLNREIHASPIGAEEEALTPTNKQRVNLRCQEKAMRWARSMIASIKKYNED